MRGHHGQQTRTDMYEFNTRTRECKLLSYRMPRPIWSTGAVVGTGFFLVGGYTNDNYEATMQKLDLETGQWRDCALMHTARFVTSVAVFKGKVYVAGGFVGEYIKDHECYDPVSDTWTQLAPLLYECARGGFITCGDYIYMLGGYSESELEMTRNQRYNPATNTWQEMAPLPRKRWAHAVGVTQNCIYVIGGHHKEYEFTTSVDVYDTVRDEWREGPELPYECSNGAGISFSLLGHSNPY